MPGGTTVEVLRFDDLGRYLLLKNGNLLYKVPFRGDWAVLKVYHGSRTRLQYITKSLGNLLVCNQTSFMPRARWRTEMQCLKLWRDAGVRVLDTYDVKVEGLPDEGYALFEYAPGRKFVDYFADDSVSLQEKVETWRRFLHVWHRRHRQAIDRREPRLVHENGDLKHVMFWKDDLCFFDFEMCFRSRRRVREFVAREILAYLKSMGKTVGAEHWEVFLAETVEHYPDRGMLEYTYAFAFRNPNPVLRLARWLDRKLKAGAKKPHSKYRVAEKLHQLLATR